MDRSIIVVAWNTRELVLECLRSVERAMRTEGGGAPLRVEVQVVDNGSSDGTAEAVRAEYPQARLIRLSENLGFAAGSNTGIRRASGRARHLLLLNSDARLMPDALERCVKFLDDHPDVGIVGPRLLRPDGSARAAVHNEPRLITELVPVGVLQLLFPRRFPSWRRSGSEPFDVEAVSGAALFARSQMLEWVGLLSEQYFFFLEETDWCRRVRRAGWRVVHHPGAQVIHLSGGSSKRVHPSLTRIEYHRSLYRFYQSHHGRGRAATALALRVCKAVFYVVTQAPLALFAPRIRVRCRAHWDVLLWHLRGCPASAGLSPRPTDRIEAAAQPRRVG